MRALLSPSAHFCSRRTRFYLRETVFAASVDYSDIIFSYPFKSYIDSARALPVTKEYWLLISSLIPAGDPKRARINTIEAREDIGVEDKRANVVSLCNAKTPKKDCTRYGRRKKESREEARGS